ncbi:16747_t:CDS:1 [Funneliformis geosporum]|uniref:16747_t:CDS:1 n=1 Tax=Funneliformis geosporum TaxID=1117311 RepID=A0A9W4SL42_9GLOM|nr:16747_t:CDS:1 [Funneliformis geosporum]
MESNCQTNFTIVSQNDHIATSVNAIQNTSNHNDIFSHLTSEPNFVINSEHQQNSIMQPMTLSNAVQIFQESPSYSTNYIQENFNMVRHSFFYRPCNDDHIYQINCEETTFEETISQLINNYLNSSNSNNSFLFYFQQPNDKRIYQVVCEKINIYSNEIKPNDMEFSDRHKENLEYYLKQFLVIYLAPKDSFGQLYINIGQDSFVENGNASQFSMPQQDNNNQIISSQNDGGNHIRDNNSNNLV